MWFKLNNNENYCGKIKINDAIDKDDKRRISKISIAKNERCFFIEFDGVDCGFNNQEIIFEKRCEIVA